MLQKLENRRTERQEERKILIRWNENQLIEIQILRTKLEMTLIWQHEFWIYLMNFDSTARKLIWQYDIRHSAIRHSTHCNKNSILGVYSASYFSSYKNWNKKTDVFRTQPNFFDGVILRKSLTAFNR